MLVLIKVYYSIDEQEKDIQTLLSQWKSISSVSVSGVYAVHCYREEKYYLMDVGESATPKSRLDTHDRTDCWEEKCQGKLTYAILYTPNLQQAGRMKIEQEIRDQIDPPCGKT